MSLSLRCFSSCALAHLCADDSQTTAFAWTFCVPQIQQELGLLLYAHYYLNAHSSTHIRRVCKKRGEVGK